MMLARSLVRHFKLSKCPSVISAEGGPAPRGGRWGRHAAPQTLQPPPPPPSSSSSFSSFPPSDRGEGGSKETMA
eukprot:5970183-Pyramimonas_sp.AAC.1